MDAYENEIDLQMERPAMKCVCAWCETVIREAKPGHDSEPVSHGICTPCLAKQRAQIRQAQASSEMLCSALRENLERR